MKQKIYKIIIPILLLLLIFLIALILKNTICFPEKEKKKEKTESQSLELIGEEKKPLEIPNTVTTGTIPQKKTYRLGNLAIGNIRASKIEGKYGCYISANVENISEIDIENYNIIIILYDSHDKELEKWPVTISLKKAESNTISQFYLDEEHTSLLNFKKFQIIENTDT